MNSADLDHRYWSEIYVVLAYWFYSVTLCVSLYTIRLSLGKTTIFTTYLICVAIHLCMMVHLHLYDIVFYQGKIYEDIDYVYIDIEQWVFKIKIGKNMNYANKSILVLPALIT